MEFTQDQIMAVIGSQQVEIIGLRMQLAQAVARIKEIGNEGNADAGRQEMGLAAVEVSG